MNEIEKARELQKDCIKLHMIPPILGILKVEKLDFNNNVIESKTQKSNSYVRNAYNAISVTLCGANMVLPTEIGIGYGEDTVGMKSTSGNVTKVSASAPYPMYIRIGSNGTVDTMNDYKLLSEVTTLTPNIVQIKGTLINKVLTVEFKRTFVNTSPTTIEVAETCLSTTDTSATGYMLLRDIFTPITLNQFEGVTITYTLELLYP